MRIILRNWRRWERDRVAWSSSCSRNAHDRNVLVRRAQSRIDQATLENEIVEEIARAEEWIGSGQVPFLLAEQRRGWRLMIFCARATRGLRRMGRVAWPSSCSRNAHIHKVLAWDKSASRTSASSVEPRARGWVGEKVARSKGPPRPPPRGRCKKLETHRWTRAVKDGPVASLQK